MKVNHYPDERARAEKRPAGQFSGTKWSDAPGAGNWYCMPGGLDPKTAHIITVTTRAGESYFVGPLPEGVTYA